MTMCECDCVFKCDLHIVALSGEEHVLFDLNLHEQVARRRAIKPGFALTGDAQPHTLTHACPHHTESHVLVNTSGREPDSLLLPASISASLHTLCFPSFLPHSLPFFCTHSLTHRTHALPRTLTFGDLHLHLLAAE